MTEAAEPKYEVVNKHGMTVEMCRSPGCVLAANHPPGKHAEHRVSMLACPHNVPNFGPECPICDVDTVRLGAEHRYHAYGDVNRDVHVAAAARSAATQRLDEQLQMAADAWERSDDYADCRWWDGYATALQWVRREL